MSFIVFVVLFTVLCGWLDARIGRAERKSRRIVKQEGEQ